MSLVNNCWFTATSSGTGTFTVSAAITGFLTPAQAGAVDKETYTYRASSSDESQWEIGIGVYTSSGTTLTRATIILSSNANAVVNFSAAPRVALTALAYQVQLSKGQALANARGHSIVG